MATYLLLLLLFTCISLSCSNPSSCRDRCGQGYYRGSLCQCDYECLGLNECCTDFQDLCTSKDSCKGRCGEPFHRGNPCHCDIDCVSFNQCCPDYESMCLMEDTALKPRNTGTAAQRIANSCLNIKNKKTTESSNEEMPNEEGIGDELTVPEYESDPIPSKGPEISPEGPYTQSDLEEKLSENSTVHSETEASSLPIPTIPDGSGMLPADEKHKECATQQPSEEMTSSTAHSQENASIAPTEGYTSVEPTKGPTTESPTSADPTEGPTSVEPTKGPTTESPTSADPTEGPTSVEPTKGPTTESPTSADPTEGPTSVEPTKGPTTKSPITVAPTEGPTSVEPTKGPTSVAPTQSPTSVEPTKGPTSVAPTESLTSAASTESPTSVEGTQGPSTEGSTHVGPTVGPTEVTTKESSSFKDPKATSDPKKTPSMPALMKPTKKPTQPSKDKNDKSELNGSPKDPSSIAPTKQAEKPLEPKSDENGKINNLNNYQADDHDTNLCSGRPVSGMTTLRNGTIVVFRGHYFWTLDKHRNPDPPQLITRVWGIPSPIDTVYTRCNCQGKTYFFKGKDYWRFENGVMDPGFPKSINQGFGQIGHITAALSIPEYRSRKESVIFFRRGGKAQKYTYQVTPSCGKRQTIPVFTVRTRARRQAAAALGQVITISKTWREFPTVVTSAVSVPSRVKEGYKYYVFSQSKYYNIKMEREKPVILKPAAGPKEKSANSFFKCKETQKN